MNVGTPPPPQKKSDLKYCAKDSDTNTSISNSILWKYVHIVRLSNPWYIYDLGKGDWHMS